MKRRFSSPAAGLWTCSHLGAGVLFTVTIEQMMPVHQRDRKDNNHEEMDVDYPEQDASSSDEEDSVSSSASEDGDTSGGDYSHNRPFTTPPYHVCTCMLMMMVLQKWMMKTVKEGEWSV